MVWQAAIMVWQALAVRGRIRPACSVLKGIAVFLSDELEPFVKK
jgi:hypothetical protein